MPNDGPQWDQLFRNGQLTWKTDAYHREMLTNFHNYYKNTVEAEIFDRLYPGFVAFLETGAMPDAKPKVQVAASPDVVDLTKPLPMTATATFGPTREQRETELTAMKTDELKEIAAALGITFKGKGWTNGQRVHAILEKEFPSPTQP